MKSHLNTCSSVSLIVVSKDEITWKKKKISHLHVYLRKYCAVPGIVHNIVVQYKIDTQDASNACAKHCYNILHCG